MTPTFLTLTVHLRKSHYRVRWAWNLISDYRNLLIIKKLVSMLFHATVGYRYIFVLRRDWEGNLMTFLLTGSIQLLVGNLQSAVTL